MADPTDTDAGTATGTKIAIDVEFELNTPDGLRRVNFGLRKAVEGEDIVWTINFSLFERTDSTKDFGDPIVKLAVTVDPALNARAEAARHGLTPAQTAQATGPAAEAVKAADAGELPKSVANKEVQKSIE